MNDDPRTRTAGDTAIVPYLICKEAAKLIDFYVSAFGAKEDYRLEQGDGRVGHAELLIGAARFSLADEFPELDLVSPQTRGGASVNLHLYVPDVDAFFDRARRAGARVLAEPKDEFYGDRVCRLADPSGHVWMIATHQRDVSPEEMQRRMQGS